MTTPSVRLPLLTGLAVLLAPPALAQEIDYNRDVRPILSDRCYTCHGPDAGKRKAGLRLDTHAGALKRGRSGTPAVVPGDRARSELFARLTSAEDHERMPPPRAGKGLSSRDVEVLGRWIDQGAHWESHWAYVPPRRPPLPAVRDTSWPRNAIDHFVLHRLEREGLHPAPEADRYTLLRRLSFDLTGLPPTPGEVEAFTADKRPDAYERAVDGLLASPHFGERLAQQWLDLARFADTNGYRLDNHRDAWPFRDYVIRSFNANKPFDQFTIEQLAGDLLPGATVEQKVATGFHRNTMVNFGNGSDPRDYLTRAVKDRVNTTGTVWLGTTLACAECHDHKYDPVTQKEYYRLFAFFHNVPEKGLDGAQGSPTPTLPLPSPEEQRQLDTLRRRLAALGPASALATQPEAPARDEQSLAGASGWVIAAEHERLRRAEAELLARIPTALVMEEMSRPRVTRVLLRGDYLAEGEEVTAGVPESLPPLPAGMPANRLVLARWLTDPNHPLTARVTVNRYWQLLLGAGLVRTPDDFGAQGEAPTHPELLDWLAVEFVAHGWNVKHLLRQIVTSSTYRQSSRLTPEWRERDPDNRLLARGPRFRLDAEMIRDNALAIGGLLHRTIGGPSVRPWQPAGLWEQVSVGGNYSSQTYVPSQGHDRQRRGLYTYWKRSLPYPPLATFDAPNREACTAQRPRTNTPLQALVLLNDPAYLECASGLARRALREGGSSPASRLAHAFRLCTARPPTSDELAVLTRLLDAQLANYRQDAAAARNLVRKADACDPAELAAWTAVASVLLNLDETITRE